MGRRRPRGGGGPLQGLQRDGLAGRIKPPFEGEAGIFSYSFVSLRGRLSRGVLPRDRGEIFSLPARLV